MYTKKERSWDLVQDLQYGLAMWPQHGPCFFVDAIRHHINNVVLKAQKIKVYLSGTKSYFIWNCHINCCTMMEGPLCKQSFCIYSPTLHHMCRIFFPQVLQIPMEVDLLEEAEGEAPKHERQPIFNIIGSSKIS